jgi:hypothetical protein
MKARTIRWLALAVVGLALTAVAYSGVVVAKGDPPAQVAAEQRPVSTAGRSTGYERSVYSRPRYPPPASIRIAAPADGEYARAHVLRDNVDGNFGPGVTVWFTVTDEFGVYKGGGSGTARSDGWMDGVWCGCDLVPGDQVHVVSDAGFDALLLPIPITGQIDVDADQVTGEMSGGVFPATGYIEVWSEARWEGYGAELTIDGDGNFFIDLAGQFDLWLGDTVQVWYRDPNGNHLGTELRTLDIDVNYAGDTICARTEPSATVSFEVVGKATLEAQADGNGTLCADWVPELWVPSQPDIVPGDGVYAEAAGYQASVDPVGTIDGVADVDADTIAGTLSAPWFTEPLHVRCEVRMEGGPGIDVSDVDPDGGSFVCDLGAAGWDLRPGDTVALSYNEPDGNRVINVITVPYARANIAWDNVDGWFGPGAAVSYTVLDEFGVYKGGGSGTAKSDGWMDGVGCGCDLLPGDQVQVASDAGFDATLVPIAITGHVDRDADLISGQMSGGLFPASGSIWVWSDDRQQGYGTDLTTDAGGNWSVDLAGLFDVWEEDKVEVWYRDPNGNQLGTQLRALSIQVNYANDWILALTEPYATVSFEVVGKATLEAQADGKGELYTHWVNDQWDPAQPDIQPGDTVLAATAGYAASVDPVGTIDGVVDVDADTIAGTLNAPWFTKLLRVRCEVWMEGGPGIDVLGVDPNGGSFLCDLGAAGWDVRPGDTLAMRYWEPGGDWVINVITVPYARANTTWDNVDGWFGPGVTVQYTVTDEYGAYKGGGSGTAKPDGRMDGVGCGCDLVPGDQVQVVSDAGFDALLVPIPITGQIDVDADRVSGQMSGGVFPATGYIKVWSRARWQEYGAELTIDADGNFLVDLAGQFDLWVGDTVEVWYRDPNGNHLGTELRTLNIDVNYGHDWIYASTDPNATVTFEVVGKATLEAQADGNGDLYTYRVNDQWVPAPPDIQPGDTVHVEAAGYEADVDPVGTIDGVVDVDADTIAGTLNAPWFTEPLHVRCEVWMEGGPGIDVWDVDPDGGSFLCDLGAAGWDLRPGDGLALRYFEPDGNGVINAFNVPALGLRVILPDEGVHGFFEIGHTIWLTVTDSYGTVKATATTTTANLPWGTGFHTEPEDWTPLGQPQILPYDRVIGLADNGLSTQMQIGTITGFVSTAGDSVRGTVYAPWFTEAVDVECHSWGRPGEEIIKWTTVLPDGVDEYFCAWDPVTEWDILPGQRVGVAYSGPDGNWVAASFYGYTIYLPLVSRKQ